MRAVLISTYEMGRQPFGLASPAAWLRRNGWTVECVDVSKEPLAEALVAGAELIGVYLPMHTATRLAAPIIKKVKRVNQAARLCAYGLYAPLNAEWLRSLGVDAVFGGEFEEDLTRFAAKLATTEDTEDAEGKASIPRLKFIVPDRRGLPPLDRYAALQRADGTRAIVGYTEASRGCRHRCRHCPVVPIYDGQFRVVPHDIVLADIANQVEAGAEHITFGDPDFFNGPTHAMRIVENLHRSHPAVTYDVTIKIEHLLRHQAALPRLRDTGCEFVTSAVESIDDAVLARLEKGHTRRDFYDVVALCRAIGLTLAPTFVAFHPWITLETYCELLDAIEELDLVAHVAPIQLALRLLIPRGSRLLELDEIRALVGPFDPATLTYRWEHPDPRVDALQQQIVDLVGIRMTRSRPEVFDEVSALAHAGRGRISNSVQIETRPRRNRATIPFLNEPWYC